MRCMFHFGAFPWGIGSILVAMLIAALVYAGIRSLCGRKDMRNHVNDRNDSLEILKKRLARGEISIEEFKRLKEYL